MAKRARDPWPDVKDEALPLLPKRPLPWARKRLQTTTMPNLGADSVRQCFG